MEIWAKKLDDKYQSLEEHTLWVVEEALKQIDDKTIQKVANISGWSIEKIKDLIFFSAYFHDIGKATIEFQNTIKNGTKSYHPLYGAFLLLNIKDFIYKDEGFTNLLVIIVLSHHSLFPKTYSLDNCHFTFLSGCKSFQNNYKSLYEKSFNNKECLYNFNFKEVKKEDYLKYINILEKQHSRINHLSKFRMLYTYISGILNIADWIASARFSQTTPKTTFNPIIPTKQKFTSLLTFKKLRDFQEELSSFNQSVLVEIPTGEGKTEGSLLWAINNIYDKNTKIIYTLPTQTTSNKLYERVQNFFEKDECGLIHSNAIIFLQNEYERDNGVVDEQFKSNFLVSKTFNKPITVSTIDSLLKYFINIGRFNIATKNFLNSVIIIDEVHSYDFKLMGFLKKFLELCNEYEVKVCLMSASIPNKLKELLNIQNYPIITQNDLFKKKANEIIKKDCELDEDFKFIYEKFKESKNILIIRNTVKSATDTYNYLKETFSLNNKKILLYHSTFKKKDKIKKECLIFEKLKSDKPFILVATQIVEMSLDIDFNLMFTDNAPIDSLIQRFGRVNRKKNEDIKGEIYIYKKKCIKPYTNEALLNLTFQTIQNGYYELGKYVKWLNIVYDKLFENDIEFKNVKTRLFDPAYLKYDKTIKQLNGIEKSLDNYDLRDIELHKNDYLLYGDYMKGRIEYDYTISLPIYHEKQYLYKTQEELNYKILNLEYSFEKGIIISDENSGLNELG
ncbi:CRISPR-associated helicase Cas3' [Arcobacter sp. CECT 9188]|uniref:CRISPR-associated helicase Cas3' n=1 Tax=Arcobacter sp. CECT 9188 TaxID=2044505 RepID=UPI000DEBF67B|nr:CRISPR-associated helicase Cas3' [Arcobacter sp. CECT 9188]RBQ25784.1 CRISPR-associated helicase/endonuclease Cas3 [Arcobacter sp. CECT 9188]